jgi:hypothetical protein
MAAVLFVELPSANTEAAAGNRGGFFYLRALLGRLNVPARDSRSACASSGKNPHPPGCPLAPLISLR